MALRTPIGTDDSDDDRVRFEELWADREILHNYCRRVVGDSALVDDMVQEAYAEAFAKLDRLERRGSFLPWLATVAKRRSLNEMRRYRYATPVAVVPERPGPPNDDPADIATHRDQVRRVRDALTALTPRERQLLMSHVNDHKSVTELASDEDSTPASVRSVLLRARAKLRAQIDDGAAWVLAPLTKLGDWTRRRLGTLSARVTDATPITEVAYQRMGEVVAAAVVAATSVVGGGAPATTLVLGRSEVREAAITYPDPAYWESNSGSLAAASPIGRLRIAPSDSAVTASDGDLGVASTPSGSDHPSSPTGTSTPNPIEPPVTPPEPPPPPPPPINSDPVEDPDDAHFTDLVATQPIASDAGQQQVFALGKNAGSCASDCTVLFLSPDSGTTWQKLPAVGIGDATSLVLAPSYPADRRIYAMGHGGLRVSADGGASFVALPSAPHKGPMAISPLFSQGDARILIGSQPAFVYDAAHDTAAPFTAAPMTGATNYFAFSPNYATSRLLFAGTAVNGPSPAKRAVIHRCIADQCDAGVEVPGLRAAPLVAVSSTFDADGIVFAWRENQFRRSDNRGEDFSPVDLSDVDSVVEVIDDSRGNFFAGVKPTVGSGGGVLHSEDGGKSWVVRGEGTPLEDGASTIMALADGRILASSSSSEASGMLCSRDLGVTWARRCA